MYEHFGGLEENIAEWDLPNTRVVLARSKLTELSLVI